VAALFNDFETRPCFSGGCRDSRGTRRNVRRDMGRQNDEEGVDGSRKIVIGGFNLYFTGPVEVRAMVTAKVGMDERRVVVIAAIMMYMLKRRQDKAGH
jgi:hypothetical protein